MSQADSEEVFVANAHPSIEVSQNRVRQAALAVLRKEGQGGGRVNIILATDADLADLNAKYRSRDGSTDVLSFPMGGDEHAVQEEQVIGEVYISLDRARQQAKDYKVSLAEEVDRLVIHGALHLCGYDHEDERDARLMKAKEKDFLEKFR
jgi:probable rRNA maturation factor